MTTLKDIRIYISPNAKNRPTVQVNLGGMDMLYNIHLEKNLNFICRHINIYLTNEKSEIGTKMEVKNFFDIYTYFDFHNFEALNDCFSKSQILIDTLHKAITDTCHSYEIDSSGFNRTYQKCYADNLICKWLFQQKLFKSPNKKHSLALEYAIDFDGFRIFEVLYNANQEEIARRVCFMDNTTTFTIKWASWQSSNNTFYYSFGYHPNKFVTGPKKIFECHIEDLKISEQLKLPKKASEYFK